MIWFYIGIGIDLFGGILKELHANGVSWGAVLTALLLWNKVLRNKEFKERDERVERNQQRIMAHLGVEGEWSTPQKTLMNEALTSLRKWYFSLQAAIARVFHIRRGSKMSKAWLVTLVAYVLGAAAKKWGIVFPDETANWIVDGVMMAIPVILAFMNRKKKESVPSGSNAQYSGDGPAV